MDLKIEIARKTIHLSSCIIGFSILILDKSIYMPIILGLSLFIISFDFMRIKYESIFKIYNRVFNIFTRDSERAQLTGASFMFLGISIVTFFFDKEIAAIGLLIMSLSDSFAALAGIIFGKTRLFNKTLEGSTVFFITTFTILLFFNFSLFEIVIISTVSTITELFSSYKYNDNVSIPLVTCFTIYMLKFV